LAWVIGLRVIITHVDDVAVAGLPHIARFDNRHSAGFFMSRQMLFSMFSFSKLSIAVALATTTVVVDAQPMLEEVVVTAQRREQSLQDAPVAITAFSAEDIDTRGIRDVKDISLFVPNVNIAPAPGGSTGATIAFAARPPLTQRLPGSPR